MLKFGTDGIRGVFDEELSLSFVKELALAIVHFLQPKGEHPAKIILGRDTRASGVLIEKALLEIWEGCPMEVVSLGVVPTPLVSREVLASKADLGIVITASHNPVAYNGIKIFNKKGHKLNRRNESKIEKLLEKTSLPLITGKGVFKDDSTRAIKSYLDNLLTQTKLKDLKGKRIVLDTANGATVHTSPAVFKKLGAELIQLGNRPNGKNINSKVGSQYTENLSKAVLKNQALLGIAYDGDGDRVVVVDEKGIVIPGDCLIGILALTLLKEGKLGASTLVITEQSNCGLDETIQRFGGKVSRVGIGDRQVLEGLLKVGGNFGGESSGHLIDLNYLPSGDGLWASLLLLKLIQTNGKPLSVLKGEIPLWPQMTDHLVVAEKKPLSSCKHFNKTLKTVHQKFKGKGRCLVRYSGTEPKLRFLVEGSSKQIVQKTIQALLLAVKEDFNVSKTDNKKESQSLKIFQIKKQKTFEEKSPFEGHRERLRDRFVATGFKGFSDHEMVELLLTLAIPRKDVKIPAKRLIQEFGSLKNILDAPTSELYKLPGIGKITAISLSVIKETIIHYLQDRVEAFPLYDGVDLLIDLFRTRLGGLKYEVFEIAYLDHGYQLLRNGIERIEEGTPNRISIYPRKLIHSALKRQAVHVVICHNHPTGDLQPSQQDINLTNSLKTSFESLELRLLDHIIVSQNDSFSFLKEGLI